MDYWFYEVWCSMLLPWQVEVCKYKFNKLNSPTWQVTDGLQTFPSLLKRHEHFRNNKVVQVYRKHWLPLHLAQICSVNYWWKCPEHRCGAGACKEICVSSMQSLKSGQFPLALLLTGSARLHMWSIATCKNLLSASICNEPHTQPNSH